MIVPADFVMARQMLRGVRSRAEATTAADLARLERPLTDASHPLAPRPAAMEVS